MATTKTHTAIATTAKGVVEQITVSTPTPKRDQVLIRVSHTSMIAFDTYQADLGYAVGNYPLTLGFNAAGTVVEVGEDVGDLKVGDRVTAFTMQSKGMQEYTVQPRAVCAKIPDTLSFAEAATIPDNFITAFNALFNHIYLALPIPPSLPASESPKGADVPILIYGAGSTTGQYAIQLLALAGYKRILATASPHHHAFLRSLGATGVFDYKNPTLAIDIAQHVGGDGKVDLVLDCITTTGTIQIIAKLVSEQGKVALLLPIKEGMSVRAEDDNSTMHMTMPEPNPLPKGTAHYGVRTFLYLENEYFKENLMPKVLPKLLADSSIKPNRVKLLDQGPLLERVKTGLDLLRSNKVSGEKVVVKLEA